MSHLSQGFVRDSRFGSGWVIKGTNRETTRKWRKLGVPDAPGGFAKGGVCTKCGKLCCVCERCVAFKGGEVCAECSGIPGVKTSNG